MKNFLFGGNDKKQSEIDSLKVELTRYQTTNNQLVEQLKSVQEQLRRREAQLGDERAIIDTLRTEKSVLGRTISKNQSDYENLVKLRDSEKKAGDRKMKEMMNLVRQMESQIKTDEDRKLIENDRKMHQKLQSDQKLKSDQKLEIDRKKLHEIQECNKVLSNSNKTLLDSNKQLESQNRNTEMKLTSSLDTKKLLKAKLTQKDDDISQLEDKNQELTSNLISLQKQMRSAKRSFETAETEAKVAKQSLKQDYGRDLEKKDTDLDLVRIKCEKLEKNYENLEFKSQKVLMIYKGHLLNAARGVWDEDVRKTILGIFNAGDTGGTTGTESEKSSTQVSPLSNTSSKENDVRMIQSQQFNPSSSMKRPSRSGSILAKLQESTTIR